jgi:hypothetical protein
MATHSKANVALMTREIKVLDQIYETCPLIRFLCIIFFNATCKYAFIACVPPEPFSFSGGGTQRQGFFSRGRGAVKEFTCKLKFMQFKYILIDRPRVERLDTETQMASQQYSRCTLVSILVFGITHSLINFEFFQKSRADRYPACPPPPIGAHAS